MLLSQYGLGFRPNRTPEGAVELLCVLAAPGDAVWPVGWDTPEGTYPAKLAPKLFEQTMVELKDQKLMDILQAIEEKTGAPVRVDLAQAETRGLALDSVLVSVPRRRMTWSQLLSTAVSPSFLSAKIRVDESRKPLVWITGLSGKPGPFRSRLKNERKPRDIRQNDAASGSGFRIFDSTSRPEPSDPSPEN